MNEAISFSRPCFGEAEAEAAAAVVRSGWVVGGPRLAEFERRFAQLCGAEHAVGDRRRPRNLEEMTPGGARSILRHSG